MLADQTAEEKEEKKLVVQQSSEPPGLLLNRKSMREWNCRFLEDTYEILEQVGEGTFR